MRLTKSIAFKNIVKRPLRSAGLAMLSAFLAFTLLVGGIVTSSLRQGFSSLRQRLGADIMVVPYEAATKADLSNIVLQGNTGYFYMDEQILRNIAGREGIGQISAQFYLASTSSGCCSLPVQIIGFDPETDFAITPWIKKSYGREIGYLEVVVGNDLNAFVGDELSFYGTNVRVAAKLDKTGTSYDTAVFTGRDTIEALIQSSLDLHMNTFSGIDPQKVVSCILINVADGYVVEEVLNDINIHVKKVKAVQTKEMISGIADSLSGISDVAGVVAIAVWLLAFLILSTAFFMMANERKKEFAVFRVVGASQRKLSGIILGEGALLSLLGSGFGVLLGLLVLLPFDGYIEGRLGLPYLLPPALSLVFGAALSLLFAVLSGSLTSAAAAFRISRMETGLILREAG